MQTAKGSQKFKYEHYDVSITVFSQKKLEITVVDSFEKIQFHQKLLTLSNIGTTTLIKALEKKMLQIKLGMKVNRTPESAVLQIDILVASQFLKPVEETIYLKKSRDISESQILKNAVNLVASKIKNVKEGDQSNYKNNIFVGPVQEGEKTYNVGTNYDVIASIKLPKGKYVLTISYLLKASNSWMYLYFQQGQQVIQNCGFYIPTNNQFIPIIVRKNYTVAANQENVTFTTYYGQSYPCTLKNVVLSAQQIS